MCVCVCACVCSCACVRVCVCCNLPPPHLTLPLQQDNQTAAERQWGLCIFDDLIEFASDVSQSVVWSLFDLCSM